METVEFMEKIGEVLAEAAKYQLDTECLSWALRELCNDDEKIIQALWNGYHEWVK